MPAVIAAIIAAVAPHLIKGGGDLIKHQIAKGAEKEKILPRRYALALSNLQSGANVGKQTNLDLKEDLNTKLQNLTSAQKQGVVDNVVGGINAGIGAGSSAWSWQRLKEMLGDQYTKDLELIDDEVKNRKLPPYEASRERIAAGRRFTAQLEANERAMRGQQMYVPRQTSGTVVARGDDNWRGTFKPSDEDLKKFLGSIPDDELPEPHIVADRWLDMDGRGELPKELFPYLEKILRHPSQKQYFGDATEEQLEKLDDDILRKYRENVHNYQYKYKKELQGAHNEDPDKEFCGPMAQDIENVHSSLVQTNPETGYKEVDTGRVALLDHGAIAALARKVDKLEEVVNGG